jgi:hypothetical protein
MNPNLNYREDVNFLQIQVSSLLESINSSIDTVDTSVFTQISQEIDTKLQQFSQQTFKDLAEQLIKIKDSLETAKTLYEAEKKGPSHLRPAQPLEEEEYLFPITEENIKATFYYQIPVALQFYKDRHLVTLDDIEDAEPFLFPADGGGLPAMVLIYVMQRSKHVENGLLLNEDIPVKAKNCPALYAQQFPLLLNAKKAISTLSEEEVTTLIKFCLGKEEAVGVPQKISQIGIGINMIANNLRQNFNKDINSNLVIMLNLCKDALS